MERPQSLTSTYLHKSGRHKRTSPSFNYVLLCTYSETQVADVNTLSTNQRSTADLILINEGNCH